MPTHSSATWRRIPSFLRHVGPGVVTGAADDDPSGIATYTQAGAQFGTSVLWTVFLTLPFMIGIQLVSARIGRQSGQGIAANLRVHTPRAFLYAIVALLLIANTVNIAADIAAMGEALQLVVGGGDHFHAVAFGVITLLLQIFVPYRRLAPMLKWLTLALFVYVAAAFSVNIPWAQVLHDLVLPRIVPSSAFWMMIVALLGTTISPYLFFWQAAQEVEEMRLHGITAGHESAHTLKRASRRMRLDTVIGMVFSNGVAFFVMLMGAVVLHAGGVTDVTSAAQAAQALRPLARRAGAPLARSQGLLRDHRPGHPRWHRARLHARRPDESALLERGDQRRGRRADHGRNDVARGPTRRDGVAAGAPQNPLSRLGRGRLDDGRGADDGVGPGALSRRARRVARALR
jgi:Mn2+/Fe2+ NRAMP family transporter